MTTTVHRGWLVAALVLAVGLLVASVAMVATHAGQAFPGDASRWGTTQSRVADRPGPGMWGGTGMMGGARWSDDRADRREDCLDLMRGRDGR